jgi:2-polyprenyl-6-methoxyphenol hydroxylase-like FAD-dependent oxidoreductase
MEPLLVVGAGPTGLAAALFLLKAGTPSFLQSRGSGTSLGA